MNRWHLHQHKMMVWCIFSLAAVGFSFLSAPPAPFVIKGRMEALKDGDQLHLMLLHTDEKGNRLSPETLALKRMGNEFEYRGKVEGVKVASLVLTRTGTRSMALNFYAEPGNISVLAHTDSLEEASVTGTFNNNLQTKFRKEEAKTYLEIRTLYKNQTPENASQTEAKTEKLRRQIDDNRKAMIRQYPDAMISVTYLYVLQDKIPVDTLKQLFALLKEPLKKTSFGIIVAEKIPARERTLIGKVAPAFEAYDREGNKLSTASMKGKYVLLDFWASWCVPCRAENPHLVKAFEKFKNKGFSIVSITLDDNKAKWEEAILKDKLVWTHISDVKGFANPIARLYGVQPIPDNFLLDPQGNIIARRLRGDEINELLEKLLK